MSLQSIPSDQEIRSLESSPTLETNSTDMVRLQQEILALREEKSALDNQVKTINTTIDGKETALILAMQAAGLTSLKTAHGSVSLQSRFSVRLPESQEDWGNFFEYLKTRGHYEGLRTVNSQRLNAWYKTELEQAKERGEIDWCPPGLKEPSVHEYLSFRKA